MGRWLLPAADAQLIPRRWATNRWGECHRTLRGPLQPQSTECGNQWGERRRVVGVDKQLGGGKAWGGGGGVKEIIDPKCGEYSWTALGQASFRGRSYYSGYNDDGTVADYISNEQCVNNDSRRAIVFLLAVRGFQLNAKQTTKILCAVFLSFLSLY